MIGEAVLLWLAVGALVAWRERSEFFDDDNNAYDFINGAAALFVLAVLWPGVLVLKALRWWRRR